MSTKTVTTRTKTITINHDNDWEQLRPWSYCRQAGAGSPPLTPSPPSLPPELPRRTILLGDATEQLAALPSGSIDCCITSPPYFLLRDYGTEKQLGLEGSVEGWVNHLRPVMAQVARVLKPTGSLWLNLGDSFSRHEKYGAPAKSLLCAPERLLLALSSDGWIVRNKVIWSKPNPMPSSVSDRLNTTYEVIYFLVRSPLYFFDLDAIREPLRSRANQRAGAPATTRRAPPRPSTAGPMPPAPTGSAPATSRPFWAGPLAGSNSGLKRLQAGGAVGHTLGKNPGDVWSIATRGFRGAHFATFPEALVEKPLLASCPEAICTKCGEPWKREATRTRIGTVLPTPEDERKVMRTNSRWETLHQVGELIPCACGAGSVPGIVLDPFFGSGTVGVVAERLGRDWVGVELNSEYRELAWGRIEAPREKNEEARSGGTRGGRRAA